MSDLAATNCGCEDRDATIPELSKAKIFISTS